MISQIADLTANRKAFVTKSVRELMFEGYDDPLLQMASLVGKGPKKMGFFYDVTDKLYVHPVSNWWDSFLLLEKRH